MHKFHLETSCRGMPCQIFQIRTPFQNFLVTSLLFCCVFDIMSKKQALLLCNCLSQVEQYFGIIFISCITHFFGCVNKVTRSWLIVLLLKHNTQCYTINNVKRMSTPSLQTSERKPNSYSVNFNKFPGILVHCTHNNYISKLFTNPLGT